MIRKLRLKLMGIVMAVVTLILLAIFSTMFLSTRQKNERVGAELLYQALHMPGFPDGEMPPAINGRFSPEGGPAFQTRLPVLILETDADGHVSVVSNQLHFIGEEDAAPLAALVLRQTGDSGVLSGYALRYLRESTAGGVRMAFADISMEQEVLRTQVVYSLLIGAPAMLAFFFLSLFLSRWAVRPVEIAWEQQKQFIADASHELKTPLTIILSNADLLRTEKAPEDAQNARRIEHIDAEARRMKQLLEDMLALAGSDSREKTLPLDPVDFSYIVKSAVLMYEPVFYDEGKALSYEIQDNLIVKGDAPRLQQVAHILLDNARKYSAPRGAVRVTVSKTDHKNLLLQVSNTGTPIPKADLQRIFLRFYRRDESRSGHGGFGLGLSIAQSIVGEHKGVIWADSDGKSGNTFYVSLPMA